MPQSKKRPHHEQHRPQQANTPHPNATKTNRAIWVAVIFFALIGLGISFFAAGSSIIWLIVGTLIGGFCGYLFGQQIDKAISKK